MCSNQRQKTRQEVVSLKTKKMSETATDEPINKGSPNRDHYEAEAAFRSLNTTEDVPFMVEGYEPSHVLFPTLMRRYLTGSRAEFLYTNNSDYDYLYEIGPGVVHDFRRKRHDDPPGPISYK